MIRSLFLGPPPERSLLPGARLRAATPYVIGIMTFAMIVVAAAGLAIANTASLVGQSIEQRHVVQIPDGRGGKLETAVRAATMLDSVRSARPVPEEEMRRTLERWLGPVGVASGLPVPALVHLELEPGADPRAVERSIRELLPTARLIAERSAVAPLLDSLRLLQWLALALVLLMAGAMAAAVVLAARGALDTHRQTIEIMHGIGATDDQLAALFQRKIALDSAIGALAGGAAAVLVLLVLGVSASGLTGSLVGRSPLGTVDLLILAALPLAAVAVATIVARRTVLGALRASP